MRLPSGKCFVKDTTIPCYTYGIKFSNYSVSGANPNDYRFYLVQSKSIWKGLDGSVGMTDEKVKSGNMAVIFIVSFLFAVLLAVEMNFVVIHQLHLGSIFFGQDEAFKSVTEYLDASHGGWTENFRTFKHGLTHGIIAGVLFALPILATNALFERKGTKYILVNAGYWIITIGLMGGVICQFS